ncbi:hypothetical protein PAXRUDRAFT_40111, partial [Paxillus rubicundulus Ve08.2h10]
CKWASGKLFPWKSLPAKPAKSGVRGINYPAEVSFPGEERNPHPKGGSKGISDLTLAECSMFVAVLRDTSKGVPVRTRPDPLTELMASWVPVIKGTAPEHDSPHPCAKRMFCNLKTDHQGLPLKYNPAATHIKKRTAHMPLQNVETIYIPNSDNIVEVVENKSKTCCVAPSVHESDGIEEVPRPSKKHISKRPEVVITRSAKLLKKVTTTFADDDLSSLSGSEYQPEEDTS